MICRLLFIAFIFFQFHSFGQLQESYWIFGFGAEVVFENNEPQDSGDGALWLPESSATICNSEGELQFFTDGIEIYDSAENPMPNGSVVQGHHSSTQNVIIVPQPGDIEERFYYVFGVPAAAGLLEGGNNPGMEVVKVDMQANNGMGDVVEGPTELTPTSAEMLHATYHANGKDVWVVSHEVNSSIWHAILVSCDGISEHEISESGVSFDIATNGSGGALGGMKFSPDRSKIAATFSPRDEQGVPLESVLLLGSFDNGSGSILIEEEIVKPMDPWHQGYSVCFSPNSELVYWTVFGNPTKLFQYQFSAEDILTTEELIATSQIDFGSMVIAPNGKIYIARGGAAQRLSVLNEPNGIGAEANFEDEAVNLTGSSALGLPNLWMFPYLNNTPEEHEEFYVICESETITLAPEDQGEYLWSTGDQNASIEVNQPGEYWVEVRDGCYLLSRWDFVVSTTPDQTIQVSTFPELVCEGEEFECTVSATSASWTWSDGSVANPRTFIDTILPINVSQSDCSWEVTPNVEIIQQPVLNLPELFTLCNEDKFTLTLDLPSGWQANWSDGSSGSTFETPSLGTYILTTTNHCGEREHLFEIQIDECNCEVYIPNAFTPDQDGTNENLTPFFSCNMDQFQWTILNRWGEEVFEGVQGSSTWNGSHQNGNHFCEDGIYNYVLSVTWSNGETELIKGSILLMR
ncbi:MAG: gliding motility-associated C-terminal domain-containing protein [Bacteroidota bacterium]